jgi:hypothetical protein
METAHSRYQKLIGLREPYLNRARTCAELTIPSLFPREGVVGDDFIAPYQGDGARGVNSLSAKLLTALFPPNNSFFQMTVDIAEIGQELPGSTEGEIVEGLRYIERMVNSRLEQKAMRTNLFQALRQLVVGGNTLLYIGKEKLRVHRLDNYVVSRDGEGKPDLIIIREQVNINTLPSHVQLAVSDEDKVRGFDDRVYLYTVVELLPNGNYSVQQEAVGERLGDVKYYRPDALPFLPLRMVVVDGEDYGRSYVEEHISDLQGLEALTKAIREGTMAAARVLFFIRNNSSIKIKNVRDAVNGDFVNGNIDDIGVLQMNKFADFRVALEEVNKLRSAITAAFLMVQSVQRDAERVTAEEIRRITDEIQSTLGGVYSLLAQELQLPLVKLVITRLEQERKLTKLPKGIVPKILTGLSALGRMNDLNNLSIFLQSLAPLGAEVVASELNVDEYIKRVANATNIDIKGLIKSPEQKKQEAQQQAMMQTMQQAVPAMARK